MGGAPHSLPGAGHPASVAGACPACGSLYVRWLDWYVVHTEVKAEPVVNDKLKKLGYSTLFLHYIKEIKHARKVKRERRAYFPRYLFVGVPTGYGLYDVNNMVGVSTVLHSDGRPLRLDESVVEDIRTRAGENGLIERVGGIDPDARARMSRGDWVRIIEGPFTGLWAEVVVDKGREVVLTLQMFGRELTASMFPEVLSPDRQRVR
jgi:transcription antitermination factor NusG